MKQKIHLNVEAPPLCIDYHSAFALAVELPHRSFLHLLSSAAISSAFPPPLLLKGFWRGGNYCSALIATSDEK